jgi:opacity protein-like surface antigen
MKTRRKFFAASLALVLAFAALASVAAPAASAQDQPYGALERGYRTGYSDGYQSGWSDQSRRASADLRSKEEYQRADRGYVATFGAVEDYRDGYQQGYEVGYNAGYNRRGFDSNLPAAGVQHRGATSVEPSDAGDGAETGNVRASDNDAGGQPQQPVRRQEPPSDPRNESESSSRGHHGGGSGGSMAGETVMLVELQNRLSTDVSQTGDRFEARVLEPHELAGAVVAGRLKEVQRSGRSKGRALLQLDFDQIQMPNAGWQNFSALVIEVLPSGEENNVGEVDPEGGVRGKSTTKDDATKVGAAAGVGAIIGAIAGGGKGAAIGAVIGGSAGGAGVMTQRGKDIRLEPGQQLRIRATNMPR